MFCVLAVLGIIGFCVYVVGLTLYVVYHYCFGKAKDLPVYTDPNTALFIMRSNRRKK